MSRCFYSYSTSQTTDSTSNMLEMVRSCQLCLQRSSQWRKLVAQHLDCCEPIPIPKRIVLRFSKRSLGRGHAEPTIADVNLLCPSDPDTSNKMAVVLDLYCNACPNLDLGTIRYRVFKVKKLERFAYQESGHDTPDRASHRCAILRRRMVGRADALSEDVKIMDPGS